MGVVTLNLILPPLPLSNNTSQKSQSQALSPKKKAIFFNSIKKNVFAMTNSRLS
jgi:hypothetical protein